MKSSILFSNAGNALLSGNARAQRQMFILWSASEENYWYKISISRSFCMFFSTLGKRAERYPQSTLVLEGFVEPCRNLTNWTPVIEWMGFFVVKGVCKGRLVWAFVLLDVSFVLRCTIPFLTPQAKAAANPKTPFQYGPQAYSYCGVPVRNPLGGVHFESERHPHAHTIHVGQLMKAVNAAHVMPAVQNRPGPPEGSYRS